MFSKKRLLYSITLLLCVIIACIVISKISDKSDSKEHVDLPEIKANGTLNIVTNYNSVSYYVSGDTVAGFTHDMLNELAKKTSLKLNITVENDIEKCINGLEDGKYDIIAQNITANNSLKKRISFTKPIIRNKLVLVQRISKEGENREIIRNHLKLAGATIDVPRSSPAILRLKNLSHEIGDTIYIKEDNLYDTPQLIMKVASGEINFTVSDAVIAQKLKATMPNIDIDTDIGFTHLEAWAVRNTSPILLDSLNSWISKIQPSKEFRNIFNKYYK